MDKIKLNKIYKITFVILAIAVCGYIILYANGVRKAHNCIEKLMTIDNMSNADIKTGTQYCEALYKW